MRHLFHSSWHQNWKMKIFALYTSWHYCLILKKYEINQSVLSYWNKDSNEMIDFNHFHRKSLYPILR